MPEPTTYANDNFRKHPTSHSPRSSRPFLTCFPPPPRPMLGGANHVRYKVERGPLPRTSRRMRESGVQRSARRNGLSRARSFSRNITCIPQQHWTGGRGREMAATTSCNIMHFSIFGRYSITISSITGHAASGADPAGRASRFDQISSSEEGVFS